MAGPSTPTARRGTTCRRRARSSSRPTASWSSPGTPGIDRSVPDGRVGRVGRESVSRAWRGGGGTMDETTGNKSDRQGGAAWTAEIEQLLQDWRKRTYAAQSGHYIMTERLKRRNYLLGVPVVVVTSVVGTTTFVSLGKDVSLPLQVGAGIVSIMAAVL